LVVITQYARIDAAVCNRLGVQVYLIFENQISKSVAFLSESGFHTRTKIPLVIQFHPISVGRIDLQIIITGEFLAMVQNRNAKPGPLAYCCIDKRIFGVYAPVAVGPLCTVQNPRMPSV